VSLERFSFPSWWEPAQHQEYEQGNFHIFVLATVYLEKEIARKVPFHSVAFSLKVFGVESGNLFARVKRIFNEHIETVCNS